MPILSLAGWDEAIVAVVVVAAVAAAARAPWGSRAAAATTAADDSRNRRRLGNWRIFPFIPSTSERTKQPPQICHLWYTSVSRPTETPWRAATQFVAKFTG